VKDALPVLVKKLPSDFMDMFKQSATDAAVVLVNSIIAKASMNLPGFSQGSIEVSTGDPTKLLEITELRNQSPESGSAMDVVLESLEKMLQLWEKASPHQKPVLVFDEANKLTLWQDKYEDELDVLLSFFIKITKQQRRCHILLVTSEYRYQYWLQRSKCAHIIIQVVIAVHLLS
jgi:KaiC/GvpD/RAD55 family RecA-like ATPase